MVSGDNIPVAEFALKLVDRSKGETLTKGTRSPTSAIPCRLCGTSIGELYARSVSAGVREWGFNS